VNGSANISGSSTRRRLRFRSFISAAEFKGKSGIPLDSGAGSPTIAGGTLLEVALNEVCDLPHIVGGEELTVTPLHIKHVQIVDHRLPFGKEVK
jgi:hypothetical protein